MSGGGGRTRPRHVGRWRPNAAAPCRAVAAKRGRAMSGGSSRTRPRHVGQWRSNAAAPCRAVVAERGRVMSGGGGGRMRRRRPNAAAPCRAVAAERGRSMSGGGGLTRPYGGREGHSRLSRDCRLPVARLSLACRAPVADLSPACRAPVARLSPACRAPVARLSRACRPPVARLSPACRAPAARLSRACRREGHSRLSRACRPPVARLLLGLGLNKNSDWDKIRTSNNIRYFHSCRFRHPNLVSLMGFHKSNTKTALVYEYMHGRSLYSHLHDVRTYIEYFLCTKIVCIIGNC